MCINRQTLLIFYIFYYTFVFLVSVPLWQCYKVLPGSVWRREAVALTWQADQVVAQVARAPSATCSLRLVSTGPSPRCLQLPWLSPSVLTGNDGRGRSAFLKPKITGVCGGWGGGGPERTRPLLALCLPSLLLPSLLPPLLLLCGCFNDWAKACPCTWPWRTNSPWPLLACKGGWGLRGPGVVGLGLLTDSSTWSPAQNQFPF